MVAHREQPADGAAKLRIECLGPPANGAFDAVAELAANRCGTAVAIVNVTDAEGLWTRAETLACSRQSPVSTSVFVREGASASDLDPVLLVDPEVALAQAVPFYASIPITADEGRRLGTITLLDDSARDLDGPAIADLKLLASLVIDSIELRLSAKAEIEARG